MATTGNLMGLLAAEERRKRSRTERDEDEEREEEKEPDLIPELPIEMQLAIVKRAELGRSGAVPEPSDRLIEVSKIWHEVYTAWRAGRALKMEHRPDLISLDTARLFISPRFKLISEMQWPAVREILGAYTKHASAEIDDEFTSVPILVLYRATPTQHERAWEWNLGFIESMSEATDDRIIHDFIWTTPTILDTFDYQQFQIVFTRDRISLLTDELADDDDVGEDDDSVDDDYDFEAPHFPRVRHRILITDMLIYGRTYKFPSGAGHQSRADILGRLQMAGNLFWTDAARFDRPTRGMLAWRDKIVVVEAAARRAYIRAEDADDRHIIKDGVNMDIDMSFYQTRDSKDPDRVIRVVETVTAETTIRDIVRNARIRAIPVLSSEGTFSLGASLAINSDRVRVEVVWPNGARVKLFEQRGRIDRVFAIPEDEKAFEAIWEDAIKLPEPALESFEKHSEWGYELKMYVPSISDDADPDNRGMLIMPAPWFFYLAMKGPESEIGGHFAFVDVGFWFQPASVQLLTIDSSHIYAHQTFELIFLPNTLDIREVEAMTLLQKKSLKHRATAPLVAEVAEGIELL